MIKTPHTNPAHDQEMDKMAALIKHMENTLSSQFDAVCQIFLEMDTEQAKLIHRNDLKLNDAEGRALRQAIAVLARYQPVAEDLRTVIGAIYAAAEYERMGDYIKNLTRSIVKLAKNDNNLRVFPTLNNMAQKVHDQFKRYLEIKQGDDLEKAIEIWKEDEVIDEQFQDAVNEAVENQSDGDGDGKSLIYAVTIANNLERMGDRIKNLVELFYYRKTGQAMLDTIQKK